MLAALGLSLAALALGARRHLHLKGSSSEARQLRPRAPKSRDAALAVYDGKLSAGWDDWGWGPHEIPSAGPAKVQFRGYGGIILQHELLTQRFGGLALRYKPPSGWPEFLQVSLKSSVGSDAALPTVALGAEHVTVAADGWREGWLDLDELNPQSIPFDRIVVSARTSVGADWVLLDKISLTKPDAGPSRLESPPRSLELGILCAAPSHPIDPMIYGSALGDWQSGQSAQRIGGNPTSRTNWDLSAWNTANDWFFENVKGSDMGALIDEALTHGAPTAVTVPIIGWVAKDTSSVGFPASKFPKQRKFDPNRPEAGDGYLPDGTPIPPGPPSETSTAAAPELIGQWIRALRDKDRARTSRGVRMYILDNEPSLWDTTHRDVHPEPLGYDELLDRTLRYATEIRAADPDSMIAGPAEWGWLGYLYSARDRVAGKSVRPDRRAHGDVPLIPWYLQRIAEREKATGVHLLDVLDVHFYPAADRVFGSGARTDADGAALRLRSTRALWDPEYTDESWIGEKIRLIPRLKEWVAENHPGLRVSLGEWSFGADEDISGGLATAEALGRFGQQALDSAFYWGGPKAGTATFWAFRAFRNFDSKGGRFLDESLTTREGEQLSLFASRDPARRHVVAIAVNRDPATAVAARIRLDACGSPSSARAFSYARGMTALAEAPVSVAGGVLKATIPPYSVMVFDVSIDSPDASAR